LAASGWHTAALTMRLLVESELKPAGSIVGAGFDEFRWPHPVHPGDELRVQSEVLRGAPIEVAPRAGADQSTDDHVQSGRQGRAGAGVQSRCATPRDAAGWLGKQVAVSTFACLIGLIWNIRFWP
jgi:hypothetical protein